MTGHIRRRGPTGPHQRQAAFATFGLVVFLCLVAAFLVGVVWLTAEGIDARRGLGGASETRREGDLLLSRLRTLLEDARAVNRVGRVGEPATPGASGEGSLIDFLADVDGDPRTGGYSLPGVKGLERVVVFRPGAKDSRLLVKVYRAPDARPARLELTDILDGGDPRAFFVECRSSGGSVRGFRVDVALRSGKSAYRFKKAASFKCRRRCAQTAR